MRSEDSAEVEDVCDDPFVQAACLMGSDKCPAACQEKEDNKTDDEEVLVKSGDLAVSANAAAGKSVIIGGTNDLDTLTFKTSEEVELTKVVLERYGYSTAGEVAEVRLEDEDGNKIADERSLNSKDQVTLTIKKDYRNVDGTLNATVVVRTYDCLNDKDDNDEPFCEKNGSTIGFKVVDATSTAKNVNLGNYKPNTYDIVSYTAGTLTLDATPANKTYNYEADESYEIAKFKTTNNGSSTITVNGFTLHQYGTMSAEDFVTDVTVTANGEEVKGVKASFNKDDELVISFNSVEVASKKKVTFAVNAKLSNDFDEYAKTIAFALQHTDDINAIEGKVDARVSIDSEDVAETVTELVYSTQDHKWLADGAAWTWPVYTFNGGKIKFTSTKLGNIDAAAGSSDVVIAEGSLTITEAVKGTFKIVADKKGIDALTLVIAGEEFDSKKSTDGKTFTFNNIEIEKGGKVQFKADFESDDDLKGTIITIDTFKAFDELRYVESKENAKKEVSGSISFSKVTIQEARASLVMGSNDDDVEFIIGAGDRKVIFEGTYSARKADVYLNEFGVSLDEEDIIDDVDMTFYLKINGEEVANVDLNDSKTFSNVKVKAGEKAKIVVEAEIDGDDEYNEGRTYQISLDGEDVDSIKVKTATANSVLVSLVEKGTVDVTKASASKNTVLLRKANASIAQFSIVPTNSKDDGLYLEELILEVCVLDADGEECDTYLDGDDVKVTFGDEKYEAFAIDEDDEDYVDGLITYQLNEEIKDGLDVEVSTINKQTGTIQVSIEEVNGNGVGSKVFKKRFEKALVYVSSQEDLKGSTLFNISLSRENQKVSVSDLCLGIMNEDGETYECLIDAAGSDFTIAGELSLTEDVEITAASDKSQHMIDIITYYVDKEICQADDYEGSEDDCLVTITKKDFADYFKVGNTSVKLFGTD